MAARLPGPFLLLLAFLSPFLCHAHESDTVRTAAVRTAEGEWEIQPITAEVASANVCATASVAHKVRQGQQQTSMDGQAGGRRGCSIRGRRKKEKEREKEIFTHFFLALLLDFS